MVNSVQTFTAKIFKMEVRKTEIVSTEINGKTYRHLEVSFDDENCDRVVLPSKDCSDENVALYKRGTVGTVTIRLTEELGTKTNQKGNSYVTNKWRIELIDFRPDQTE